MRHLFLLFLLLQSSLSWSHSYLRGALLGGKPIQEGVTRETLSQGIVLEFSSPIEISLSSFALIRNARRWTLQPRIDRDHEVIRGQLSRVFFELPTLEPGVYELKWSTFAVDGHRQSHSIQFQVKERDG
jgi:methionine-rich copper-binding protein CopC